MVVDVKFFSNLLKVLEMNHNIIRDMDKASESWLYYGDKIITQCKEIIEVAKYQEERNAVFADFDEIYTRIDELGIIPILKDRANYYTDEVKGDEEDNS